mgnify:CR=1 FL=1
MWTSEAGSGGEVRMRGGNIMTAAAFERRFAGRCAVRMPHLGSGGRGGTAPALRTPRSIFDEKKPGGAGA